MPAAWNFPSGSVTVVAEAADGPAGSGAPSASGAPDAARWNSASWKTKLTPSIAAQRPKATHGQKSRDARRFDFDAMATAMGMCLLAPGAPAGAIRAGSIAH